MPPQREKPPREPRTELIMQITEQKQALRWSDTEFIARMLTFFTNVDLAMIRDELRAEQKRVRERERAGAKRT